MGKTTGSYDCSAVEMTMLEPVPVMKPMWVGFANRVSATVRMPSAVAVIPTGVKGTVCAREREHQQRDCKSLHRFHGYSL